MLRLEPGILGPKSKALPLRQPAPFVPLDFSTGIRSFVPDFIPLRIEKLTNQILCGWKSIVKESIKGVFSNLKSRSSLKLFVKYETTIIILNLDFKMQVSFSLLEYILDVIAADLNDIKKK